LTSTKAYQPMPEGRSHEHLSSSELFISLCVLCVLGPVKSPDDATVNHITPQNQRNRVFAVEVACNQVSRKKPGF